MSSFGIPAYTNASVPSSATYPYLTYQLTIGELFGGEVNMPVELWYRTESEAVPNAKAREIFNAIGYGGKTIPCDNGMIWVKRGSPWAQSIEIEGSDEVVKRRYINVDLEFFTA